MKKINLRTHRYDGTPLSDQYKQAYWAKLENLTVYPVLRKRSNG